MDYFEKKAKTEIISKALGQLVGQVVLWFLSAWFLQMGFNTVGALWPSLGLPVVTFWQVFWVRMGLSTLTKVLWQK